MSPSNDDERKPPGWPIGQFKGFMVINPLTIGPDAPLVEAIDIMKERKVSALPVVENGGDGKPGKLVGFLSQRDVRFATDPRQPVRKLMTVQHLVTVREGVGLQEAKQIMHQHRIEKLLVVDEKYHCVGIVTAKDLDRYDPTTGSVMMFDSPPPSPAQVPAVHHFRVHRGKVELATELSVPDPMALARDQYPELKRKAKLLNDRVAGRNYPRVEKSVCGVIRALGKRFDHVNPGKLLQWHHSIGADITTYGRPEFESELLSDVHAALVELSLGLDSFLGCYPDVIILRKAICSIDLEVANKSDVIAALDRIADTTQNTRSAVRSKVAGALIDDLKMIESAETKHERDTQIASALLNVQNFCAAIADELLKFSRQVWDEIKRQSIPTVGKMAKTALWLLFTKIIDDMIFLSTLQKSFLPLAKALAWLAKMI